MNVGTWGRWSDDDEVGAGNLLTPDVVRRAARLVRQGTICSLAQPLGPRTPVPGHRRPPARFMERTFGDYATRDDGPEAFRFAEDSVLLPTHAGTHIDSLAHTWVGHQLYNRHSANSVQSLKGVTRCGAEKLAPIVSRAVLLDLVPEGELSLPSAAPVGVAELEAACARAKVTPEPGDVVLLRTGWWDRHQDDPESYFSTEPGLTTDAAGWLVEHDPVAIGADNCAVEMLPFPPGEVFPVHLILIHRHGIPLIENLDLRAVQKHGVSEFLFVGASLPLVGSTASPLNPLAVL